MGLLDFLGLGAGRREKIAGQIIARLQQRGWPHPARYDAASRKLELGGGTWPVSLDVIVQPWSWDKRKDRIAALDAAMDFVFFLPPEASFENVRDRLLPILRGRKVTEAILCEPSEDPRGRNEGAFRPFGDHLAIQVAVELPHGFEPLAAQTYQRWGRGFDEVFDVAMANLRMRPAPEFLHGPEGFWASNCEDGNDLARLLLPEVFAAIALEGQPVVIGASRETIFVAGSKDLVAVEAMARRVPDYLDEHPLPISFAPLILENGAWRPYHTPDDLPAASALVLLQQAHDYEQERPMMAQRLARTGRSEEISPLMLVPTDADPVTMGFWRPTTGLVPKLDFVVVNVGRDQLVRPWADVANALGFTLEPNTASPHYYATREPDDAVMATLARAPELNWAKGRGFSAAGGRLTVFG